MTVLLTKAATEKIFKAWTRKFPFIVDGGKIKTLEFNKVVNCSDEKAQISWKINFFYQNV